MVPRNGTYIPSFLLCEILALENNFLWTASTNIGCTLSDFCQLNLPNNFDVNICKCAYQRDCKVQKCLSTETVE